MSKIWDNLKTATLPLADFAANGAIGTAAATVDVVSTVVITQTTAGISLTIPTPTDTDAGDRLEVGSAVASTARLLVNGVTIKPGERQTFLWDGTSWLVLDGGRNTGAVVSVASAPAGALLVTHNLAMPTGEFSSLVYNIKDSTGRNVDLVRDTASDTANAMGFTLPVAITANLPLTVLISPLA